jgi:hypothetical protein
MLSDKFHHGIGDLLAIVGIFPHLQVPLVHTYDTSQWWQCCGRWNNDLPRALAELNSGGCTMLPVAK